MKRTKIKALLATTDFGNEVTVMGWVKTFRNNQFIAINDGSSIHNIQAVVDFNSTEESLLKRLTTGASVAVTGTLVESLGKGQLVEIKVKQNNHNRLLLWKGRIRFKSPTGLLFLGFVFEQSTEKRYQPSI